MRTDVRCGRRWYLRIGVRLMLPEVVNGSVSRTHPLKYFTTMTDQEISEKAMQLGEKIVLAFDEFQTDQQAAMTIFGHAVGLILHTYAHQNGKDVQQEAEYFGRYIKEVCRNIKPQGT